MNKNYITLDVGNFEQLMQESINKRVQILSNLTPSNNSLFHFIFLPGDTRNYITQYVNFLKRSQDKTAEEYRELYYIYRTLNKSCVDLDSISIKIKTYLFIIGERLTPYDFDEESYKSTSSLGFI